MADPKTFGDGRRDYLEDFPGAPAPARAQHINVKVLNRVPVAKELGEGEHVYSVTGGVTQMHVRINGIIKSVTLT